MNLRCTTGFLTTLFSVCMLGLIGAGGCGGAGNCDTFAADYCARIAECDPGTYAFISGGDDSTCQARLRPTCTQSLGIDGATFTADTAGTCGKSIRSASCDDVLSGNTPAVCSPPGTRADGASCSDSLQCVSTRCTGSATMCGMCAARLKLGDACQSSDECTLGLRCKNAGTSSGTCAAHLTLGQACTNQDLCLPSLFCDDSGTASGTCATRHDVGGACLQNADCDGQKQLGCDPASKKCVAYSISYVDVSGSCPPSSTSPNYNICKGDSHCLGKVGTSGPATYTCIASLPAGQQCSNIQTVCAAGLSCTNNVCTSMVPPLACK